MACDSPLKAFRSLERGEGGKPLVTFNPLKALNPTNPMLLPCGRCTGCRLERSRQWALRCVHESQLYQENCFITLTFADEHLPANYSVDVRDWQLFMKRLRKSLGSKKIRSFACGEYGDRNLRPHYHAILFNHDFNDKIFYKKTTQNLPLYTSQSLSALWPFGHCTVGAVTFESCAYVARYVMKKITGPDAAVHYTRQHPLTGETVQVAPEFVTQSRRPGLGAPWLERFKSDVYPGDYVVERGMRMQPPRFYDQKLTEEELEDVKRERQLKRWRGNYVKHRRGSPKANTPERRHARAVIRDARIKSLQRNLKDDEQ